MYLIAGSTAQATAEEVAKQLKIPLAKTTIKRFPDNEIYVRIHDDIKDQNVALIQTAYPDTNIIELFILQDAIHQAGAKELTVIAPYLGYSRQDKQFNVGEPISARAIAEHISLHATKVITIDPHKEHLLDFFTIPASSYSAVTLIAKYFKNKNIDFILAPDKGALDRAEQAAKQIGCSYDYIEKTRIDGSTVTMKPKKINVEGKNVAIIDDIISTGGTMAQSIKQLKQQGAVKVLAACTHGLFIGSAIEKLQTAGCDEIIATDTIPNSFDKIKIAPLLSEILNQKP